MATVPESFPKEVSVSSGSRRRKRSFAADISATKAFLRERRYMPKTSCKLDYKDSGVFQWIAKKPSFESASMLVIIVNAIWLAVDADINDSAILAEAPLVFQVMENVFCTLFTAEWLIRFLALRDKRAALLEVWFIFDTVLVILMVAETWVMTALVAITDTAAGLSSASGLRLIRLFRLLRIARVMRLLRAFPELLVLVRGMAAATRSVCYALGLVVVMMYVFGILFVHLLKDTELGSEYFDSVLGAMYTLLTYGMFWDSIRSVLDDLLSESRFYFVFFMAFVMLATLMLLNLLIGVLCEVVSGVSSSEKDLAMMDNVKAVLGSQMKDIDIDQDGMITKDEFVRMISRPQLHNVLETIGVDVIAMLDLVDDIFQGGALSLQEFMETIAQFRETQTALLRDISDLKRFMATIFERISPGSISETSVAQVARQQSHPLLAKWAEPRSRQSSRPSAPDVDVVSFHRQPSFLRCESALLPGSLEVQPVANHEGPRISNGRGSPTPRSPTNSHFPAWHDSPQPPPLDPAAVLEQVRQAVLASKADILREVRGLRERTRKLQAVVDGFREVT